jgi:hypothetical protein
VSPVDDHHAQVMALIARQPTGTDATDGLVDFLRRLCAAAVHALSASGAGMNVMIENGVRGLTTASDLNSRIIIEQAKGAIAQAHGVSVDDAFTTMRDYARRTNRRLVDVAHTIVTDPALPELSNP